MKNQFWIIGVLLTCVVFSGYSQEKSLEDSETQKLEVIDNAEDLKKALNIYADEEKTDYTGMSDTLEAKGRIELGFNISPLLQRIISPATPFNPTGQELVMFNLKVNEGIYWRNGFNTSASKVTDLQDNEFVSTFNQTFLRTGLEWRTRLTDRFELHYGVDAILERRVSKFDFDGGPGNSSTTDRITNSIGLGVPLGMTYWISDRLGLWVESSLIGTRSMLTDINTFDGQEVSNQESTVSALSIKLPVSLFVKMTF